MPKLLDKMNIESRMEAWRKSVSSAIKLSLSEAFMFIPRWLMGILISAKRVQKRICGFDGQILKRGRGFVSMIKSVTKIRRGKRISNVIILVLLKDILESGRLVIKSTIRSVMESSIDFHAKSAAMRNHKHIIPTTVDLYSLNGFVLPIIGKNMGNF